MHTYTHHFIPIHTYIHTTDHVTPQYVATNLEFFVKNTLYENGSNTLIFQQICNFLKILFPKTHIYVYCEAEGSALEYMYTQTL